MYNFFCELLHKMWETFPLKIHTRQVYSKFLNSCSTSFGQIKKNSVLCQKEDEEQEKTSTFHQQPRYKEEEEVDVENQQHAVIVDHGGGGDDVGEQDQPPLEMATVSSHDGQVYIKVFNIEY